MSDANVELEATLHLKLWALNYNRIPLSIRIWVSFFAQHDGNVETALLLRSPHHER